MHLFQLADMEWNLFHVPEIYLISISWIIFLGAIGLLALKNKSLKTKLRALNLDHSLVHSENGFLRNDLSPHFLFNVMSAIQHLVLEGDKTQAVRYVNILGKYIRISMENSNSDRIEFHRLVSSLNNYIHLENLRFRKNIHLKFDIDSDLKKSNIEFPYHLIQAELKQIINQHLRYDKNDQQNLSFQIGGNNKEIIVQIAHAIESDKNEKLQHGMIKMDNFEKACSDTIMPAYATIRFSA